MQSELNPEEIEPKAEHKEKRVELWDVRRAGQMGRTQLQSITQLHEGFARSLTSALSTYLRMVCAVTLVSAEHRTYGEFIRRLPESTYLASCALKPMGVHGALQLDLKVAFPIIDLLLGGEGKGLGAQREITEIEEHLLESVARIVCQELAAAWQAVNLEVDFEKRLEAVGVQRLLRPDEKILALSFEVSLSEVQGGLSLALPVTLSHALQRKISAECSHSRPRGPTEWRERLERRLLECAFPVELGVGGLRASVEEITEMIPGTLLPLRRSAALPASLLVGGVEMFRVVPARAGERRAAQVRERAGMASASAPVQVAGQVQTKAKEARKK
jgi:flagellar motor switch protein FliM